MKQYYVYIMANRAGTLYTGVTNDLERRVYEHKHGHARGFASRYRITRLVYAEPSDDVLAAIGREKQIKGWLRSKKVALIESLNPEWRDLADEWFGSVRDPAARWAQQLRARGGATDAPQTKRRCAGRHSERSESLGTRSRPFAGAQGDKQARATSNAKSVRRQP